MQKTQKYSDDELITILVELYFEENKVKPDNAELTKITNTIRFNANPAKAEQLQPLRSRFYQKNARWPTTGEYKNLLSYFFEKSKEK
ncbi:MAG: hypothetical protein COA54_03535 [Thiotrichaceae bacterium]|nr:MAG: hypothetical protein COA54_03535 [Thiotrichaceae bacterium]